MTMTTEHAPGSPGAVADGCTCPVMDNHHGQGSGFLDGEGNPVFWFDSRCPLHGHSRPIAQDALIYQDD